MTLTRWFLVLMLLGLQQAVQACPAGIPPGSPGCIPPTAWPQNQPRPQGAPPTSLPVPRGGPVELDSFGAFAFDPQTNSFGYSNDVMKPKINGESYVDHISKSSARKAALEVCQQKGGGKGCRIIAEYRNECAAFMIGTDSTGAPSAYVGRGKQKLEAQEEAQKTCQASSPSCKPAWADCVKDIHYQ